MTIQKDNLASMAESGNHPCVATAQKSKAGARLLWNAQKFKKKTGGDRDEIHGGAYARLVVRA